MINVKIKIQSQIIGVTPMLRNTLLSRIWHTSPSCCRNKKVTSYAPPIHLCHPQVIKGWDEGVAKVRGLTLCSWESNYHCVTCGKCS